MGVVDDGDKSGSARLQLGAPLLEAAVVEAAIGELGDEAADGKRQDVANNWTHRHIIASG